ISSIFVQFYIGISFLFSFVIIYLSFWALKHPFLFQIPTERYKQSHLSNETIIQLHQKLKKLMKEEQPHLDPHLTLSILSTKLNVTTKILSQAINQIEGTNYSQFVAKHRVEEVQRLMQLSEYENMTIAAMAYDSGFSSISTFNAAFKKHTGQTAKAYRKGLEQEKG
ncbi:MAG: helix-turn-helix domain-containing protein, partial [Bacteroidota bacterium]